MGRIKNYERFSFVLHGREGAFLKKLQKEKHHGWLTDKIRDEWFRPQYGKIQTGTDLEAEIKLAVADLAEMQKIRDDQNKDILKQAEKLRKLQLQLQKQELKKERIENLKHMTAFG